VSKIKAESGQGEAANYYGMFQDEIRNLRKTNSDKIDYFPKLERPYSRNDKVGNTGLFYRQVGSQFGRSSFR